MALAHLETVEEDIYHKFAASPLGILEQVQAHNVSRMSRRAVLYPMLDSSKAGYCVKRTTSEV